MMAALEAAYKGVLMQGRFPGCVLTVTMPPQLVDVNVHPAKTEVRFAREKEVFDAVYSAVKSVLITPESSSKALAFEEKSASRPMETPHPAPAAAPVRLTKPAAEQIRAYDNMVSRLASVSPVPYRAVYEKEPDTPVVEIPKRPAPFVPAAQEKEASAPVVSACETKVPAAEAKAEIQQTVLPGIQPEKQELRFVGEVFNTYIIAQRGQEICFIDKHAAHERIIYESLMEHYGQVSSQMLLVPATIRLSGEEKNALMQHEKILADSGLEIEDFGGSSVVVRAVPADVPPDDVENLVVELASHLRENPRYTVGEKTEWVLHSIACRAAIKAGDKTHAAQLMRLAQEVMDGKIPPFCPHGRPVILRLTLKELEKQFGRQG